MNKFHGHGQRTQTTVGDYMRARHYKYMIGRFQTPDPSNESIVYENPLSFNRYIYSLNNPLKYIDPSGEKVKLSNLTEEQRSQLLSQLSALTGNVYGVDEEGYLVLLAQSENPRSQTASDFLNKLIKAEKIFSVDAQEGNLGSQAFPKEDKIKIGFKYFEGAKYPKGFNPLAFGVGTSFFHEMMHLMGAPLEWKEYGHPFSNKFIDFLGKAEEFVNKIREENGLPVKGSYVALQEFSLGKMFEKHLFNGPEGKTFYVKVLIK